MMLSIFHVLIDLWISSLKTCLFRFLAHFLIGLFVFLLLAGKNSNFEKSSLDSVNSVTQSRLTLQPHGLQHARLPCPPSTARACSNSCLLSWWCHPNISSSVIPFSSYLNLTYHQDLFQWINFCIRWPKCWSFSFSVSPSNEDSGLISFRID